MVLDLRTSDICQKKSRENKIYKISEAVVNGALGNYPPFHPWCRTIATAIIGKRSSTGKRTANDPISGKTMTIEQRDTYDDWMNKLKQKYSDREIQIQKKKIQYRKKDLLEYKQLKSVLGKDETPATLDDYQDIKYGNKKRWQDLKKIYRDKREN